MELQHYFNHIAPHYSQHDFLQKEVARRLSSRLHTDPDKIVLDAGCGPGVVSALLPNQPMIHLDLSFNMLKQIQHFSPSHIVGDATSLPIRDNSVDVIISNCALPWFSSWKKALTEFKRVLKPDSELYLTTFGLDTLQEFPERYTNASYLTLLDMIDLGDTLLKLGFRDPIVDKDLITLEYTDFRSFLNDLRGTGWQHIDNDENELNPFSENVFTCRFEIIYAKATSPSYLKPKTASIPLQVYD